MGIVRAKRVRKEKGMVDTVVRAKRVRKEKDTKARAIVANARSIPFTVKKMINSKRQKFPLIEKIMYNTRSISFYSGYSPSILWQIYIYIYIYVNFINKINKYKLEIRSIQDHFPIMNSIGSLFALILNNICNKELHMGCVDM